jgi:3-oxoacyl-[acyl-carrier-protein] synthase II
VSRVAIVAFGAISGLGRGAHAVSVGEVGDRPRIVIAPDPELARAGLERPFAARAGEAAALLEVALGDCAAELDRLRPSWRRERVGLVLGTSAGGMRAAERAFAALARGARLLDREAPTYAGPMASAARTLGVALDPSLLVLAACASSSVAIGLASRWLERGACDVALAGGFDEVTVFVAAGFEALRATTGSIPPRPFRVGRDGMCLGEGAAVLALARTADAPSAFVAGFGLSSDAVHLTAPDRHAGGLLRAARAALEDAGGPTVDLVGAHGTATPYNDAAEARAIATLLGEARAHEVVVHPFKAQIGHTLGAAGALETLACADALVRGVLPAAAGEGPVDPDARVRLLDRAERGRPRVALKLASAFGGANAALVVTVDPPRQRRPGRAAFVHAAAYVEREPSLEELAAAVRARPDRLARADALVRLTLAAVARLERFTGPLDGAGVVVGSALCTLETNALFAARVRELGARSAEPRRFPYTSPNAAPGECAIAFGLTGPGFSVGGGMQAGVDALAAGALLVESGDAERVVVVGVDEVGPVTRALLSPAGQGLRSGAVAVLISAQPRGARARVGPVSLRRGSPPSGPWAPGHTALIPLLGGTVPPCVESFGPPDAHARVVLEPV